jgi:hypothetical protein
MGNMNLGAPELVLTIYVLLFLLLFFDIYRSKSKNSFEKIVWSCVVLVLPFVGAIIYLSVGRREKFLYSIMKKFYGGT